MGGRLVIHRSRTGPNLACMNSPPVTNILTVTCILYYSQYRKSLENIRGTQLGDIFLPSKRTQRWQQKPQGKSALAMNSEANLIMRCRAL